MFYLYILRTVDNNLYIGTTNNLDRRTKQHFSDKGSRFTKTHGMKKLEYYEEFETLVLARVRESQLKKWSRAKKEALIIGDLEKLKEL